MLVVAGAVFVVVALIVGTAIGLFVMATSFGRPYVDAFAMVRWSIGLLLLLLGWEALANAARNVPPPSPGAEDPTPPAT